MTEAEWLVCNDPLRMLAKVVRHGVRRRTSEPGGSADWASPRQLRLFACACCRSVWHLLTDPRSRRAVEVAERFADGEATLGELTPWGAWAERRQLLRWEDLRVATDDLDDMITHLDPEWSALCWLGVATSKDMLTGGTNGTGLMGNAPILATAVPPAAQAALLREVCGNPFRPVTLPKGKKLLAAEKKLARLVARNEQPLPMGIGAMDVMRFQAAQIETQEKKVKALVGDVEVPWITPTVVSLATAAYMERGGEACGRCGGRGELSCPKCSGEGCSAHGLATNGPCTAGDPCPDCAGTGRVATTGHLDAARLAVLADAVQEAGCEDAQLLGHLRGLEPCWNHQPDAFCPRCRDTGWTPLRGPCVRGCSYLDLMLGKG